ncbi:MAG TPA: hypothetical protein VGD06_04610 [Acidobacteriota bacterium]
MSKRRKTALAGAIVLLVIVVVAARIAAYRPMAGPDDAGAPANGAGWGHPWRGAIHVHTTYSDGAGGVDEVAAAAAEAGLDFVVLTDHNLIGDRPRSAWHGDVLMIVGEEVSTEEGHLLALQVPAHRYQFGPTARQALDDIHDEGGWALVAHPDHAREAWTGGWGGTEGLEVVNLASSWSRLSTLGGAVALGSSLVDGDYAALRLLADDWPALGLWQTLTSLPARPLTVSRPRLAIGAADAHGPIAFPFPGPGYAETLGAVTTLVWLDRPFAGAGSGDAAEVEAELLAALRAGRAAIETAAAGDASGFAFTAATSGGETARLGDLAPWEAGPWTLRASFRSPGSSRIVLRRDAETLAESTSGELESPAEAPGTYRVEVYRSDLRGALAGPRPTPWLVSNPIYLWPAAARAGARIRRAPPLPAPPLAEDLLAAARFEANQAGVLANDVGAEAGGEMSWRLALATESARDAFAAMAWRPEAPLDWSRFDGLVVQLDAGATLRVSLEVRTLAADGSLDSWIHSLKAGPDSPATAVPWQWFRPPWSGVGGHDAERDARWPGADELRNVQGLFLLVTPAILAPGSEAVVRLRTLGLYGEGPE